VADGALAVSVHAQGPEDGGDDRILVDVRPLRSRPCGETNFAFEISSAARRAWSMKWASLAAMKMRHGTCHTSRSSEIGPFRTGRHSRCLKGGGIVVEPDSTDDGDPPKPWAIRCRIRLSAQLRGCAVRPRTSAVAVKDPAVHQTSMQRSRQAAPRVRVPL
jgi:hypothetical protein